MTERWRKKLEGIDRVGPSDDVYERAKAGPSLPEPQSPTQRTSTRVVTAIAAFVVFALAISVFAIPAVRLGNEQSFVPGGNQLQPLWPWSTTDAVKAWQDDPSPIGFMGPGAFESPQIVASAFGQMVIGWTEVYPHEQQAVLALCPPVSGAVGSTGMTAVPATTNDLCSVVHASGSLPPTMAPYAPTTGTPAFRTFDLSACPPGPVCDSQGAPPASITVVLYQPLGDAGPWAVLEAKNDYVSISLDPGTQLRTGSTAYASGLIPTGEHAVLGYHAAAEGCGEHSDTTGFERVSPDAGSDQATGGSSLGSYSRGQLQLALSPQGDACRDQAGYVFVAITDQGLATTDPLSGFPITAGVLGFAAVPVSFAFMSEGTGSPPPSITPPPPSPTNAPGHGYTDPLGWTIDVPDGWDSGPISQQVGLLRIAGAWFSGGPLASEPSCSTSTPSPGMTETSCGPPVPAPGQMVLMVQHSEKNPVLRDDSALPLDPDPFIQHQGVHGGALFHADGLEFSIFAYTANDEPLSPKQQRITRKMISSIRFEPWSPGETRNGFTALDPTNDRPADWKQAGLDWQELAGASYVYLENGEEGVLLGPIPDCGAGAIQGATTNPRAAVLECPDGTKVGWTMDGQPLSNNPPNLSDPVPANHVVRAWDGTLISPLVANVS